MSLCLAPCKQVVKFSLVTICLGIASCSLFSSLAQAKFHRIYRQENLTYAKSLPGYSHILWNPDDDVDSLSDYILKSQSLRQSSSSDIQFLKRLTSFIARNYKHGELHSHWSQDWISHLLSLTQLPKLRDFDSEIDPSQIAKSKHAFCSQVAILMAAILSHHQINFQAIGFELDHGSNGHFALIAYADNSAILVDPNLLPDIDGSGADTYKLLSSKTTASTFNQIYPFVQASNVRIMLKDFNRVPAQTSRQLKNVIAVISRWAWIPALFLCALLIWPPSKIGSNAGQ